MRRIVLIIFLIFPCQGFAGGDMSELMRVLKVGDMFDVMQTEGIETNRKLFAENFPGRDRTAWDKFVTGLYDPVRATPVFRTTLTAELDGQNLAPMIRFFDSEPGRTAVRLEISARVALLDKAVSGLAEETYAAALTADSGRLALIRDYSDANRLVDYNVEAALNSNIMFLQGMSDNAGQMRSTDQGRMLREIRNREPEIRAAANTWIYSYLLLAYAPLNDADIETLTVFSNTNAGQVLNLALFAAMGAVFDQISFELGRQVGVLMISEDI